MKNCDPLVFFPELAIDKRPGLECLMWKFSSVNVTVGSSFKYWLREDEKLTCELLAVNGLPASPISSREVPSLEHEVGDHAMETRSFVSESVLACCEFPEITGSVWDDIVIELENNATEVLVPNSDIKLSMGIRETGFRCNINHNSKGKKEV